MCTPQEKFLKLINCGFNILLHTSSHCDGIKDSYIILRALLSCKSSDGIDSSKVTKCSVAPQNKNPGSTPDQHILYSLILSWTKV